MTALYEIVPAGARTPGTPRSRSAEVPAEPRAPTRGARRRADDRGGALQAAGRRRRAAASSAAMTDVAAADDGESRLRVGGRRVRHAAARLAARGPRQLRLGDRSRRGATPATIATATAPSSSPWPSARRSWPVSDRAATASNHRTGRRGAFGARARPGAGPGLIYSQPRALANRHDSYWPLSRHQRRNRMRRRPPRGRPHQRPPGGEGRPAHHYAVRHRGRPDSRQAGAGGRPGQRGDHRPPNGSSSAPSRGSKAA